MVASAAFRSPALHASHIGCSTGPRPSHSWNAAYTGTLRYAAIANLAELRTTSAFSLGQVKIRHTISFGVPSAASLTTPATFFTSSADNQLMIAPSASRA